METPLHFDSKSNKFYHPSQYTKELIAINTPIQTNSALWNGLKDTVNLYGRSLYEHVAYQQFYQKYFVKLGLSVVDIDKDGEGTCWEQFVRLNPTIF
jgi:hypothetical protein